jgi:hypothetical protein
MIEKVFDPDTLFQRQLFFKSFRVRDVNTHHLVEEKHREERKYPEDSGEKTVHTALCGATNHSGNIESLEDKSRAHPQFVKVCNRCKQIFNSRTGRDPREDLQKYDRGENR